MVWPESRDEIERGFTSDLTRALGDVAEENPEAINESAISEAVSGASKPWFDTTAEDALLGILLLLDDSFGPETMLRIRSALTPSGVVSTNEAAQLLGRQVASNTRRMVEQMRRDNFRREIVGGKELPRGRAGMTPAQFDVIYGRGRAERIAITETTRMAEIAERSAMEVLRRGGVAVQRKWATEEDDKVCSVCRPLNDLPERLWPSSFSNGPPAHVNCRCAAVIIGLDQLVR